MINAEVAMDKMVVGDAAIDNAAIDNDEAMDNDGAMEKLWTIMMCTMMLWKQYNDGDMADGAVADKRMAEGAVLDGAM